MMCVCIHIYRNVDLPLPLCRAHRSRGIDIHKQTLGAISRSVNICSTVSRFDFPPRTSLLHLGERPNESEWDRNKSKRQYKRRVYIYVFAEQLKYFVFPELTFARCVSTSASFKRISIYTVAQQTQNVSMVLLHAMFIEASPFLSLTLSLLAF